MKKDICILFFLLFSNILSAQDPKLSHYWMDKIGANPALVGDGVTIDLNTIYRTQWTHLNSKFQTNSLTGDIYIPTMKGGFGVGLNLQNNIEGDGNLSTTKIEPAFSYWKIFGSRVETSVGMSYGFMQKRITNNFQFSDQIDPNLGFIYNSGLKLNDEYKTPFVSYSRIGGLFRYFLGKYAKSGQSNVTPLCNYIMFGYSKSSSIRPYSFLDSETFEVPITQCFHASVNLNLSEEYSEKNWRILQPYIIVHRIHYKYQSQPIFYSTTIGNRLIINNLQCYLGYRFKSLEESFKQDALILGFALNKKIGENRKGEFFMTLYYSSDLTLNDINAEETYSSHEVGLIFKLPSPFRIDRHRNNQGHRRFRGDCPGL